MTESARGIVELIEIDLAETHLESDRFGLRRVLEAVLEQRGELFVFAFARVEHLESAGRVLVRRFQVENALVVGNGLVGLVDDLFADQGDFVEQIDSPLGVGGALHGLGVEPLELPPLLGAGEDLLQPCEGALVAGPSLEDALEVGGGGFGIAQLLVVQRGRALGELDLNRSWKVGVSAQSTAESFREIGWAGCSYREHACAIPNQELGWKLGDGPQRGIERAPGG